LSDGAFLLLRLDLAKSTLAARQRILVEIGLVPGQPFARFFLERVAGAAPRGADDAEQGGCGDADGGHGSHPGIRRLAVAAPMPNPAEARQPCPRRRPGLAHALLLRALGGQRFLQRLLTGQEQLDRSPRPSACIFRAACSAAARLG
jgi:hypothetical protein